MRPRRSLAILGWLLVLLAAFVISVILFRGPHTAKAIGVVGVLAALLVYLAAYFFLWLPRHVTKLYRQHKLLQEDYTADVEDSLRGFRLHPAFKTLDWPAVILVQGNLMLTFDYGEYPNQLQGVGISWQEPQTNTIRKVSPYSTRPSSVHLSPRLLRESARKAEHAAPPNSGPAERIGNSGAGGGPPSVI